MELVFDRECSGPRKRSEERTEATFEGPRFLVLQLWPCHRTNLDDNLSKNQEKYHHGTADTDPQSHFQSWFKEGIMLG